MVETQLCKLRGTLDTFVGRGYSIFHLQYGFCELNLRYVKRGRLLETTSPTLETLKTNKKEKHKKIEKGCRRSKSNL